MNMHPLSRRRAGLGVLIFTTLVVATACDRDDSDEEGPDGEATLIETTEADAFRAREMERSVGQVETFSRTRVAAEVDGRLVEVEADVGDEVASGDVLARIDPEPFEFARELADSEVARLHAQIHRLELDLERLERMSDREYATEQEKDATRADLEATREQLRGARSDRDRAERDLRLTAIRAPVSGRVDTRQISEGDFIPAGEMAYRIQPLERFRASFAFPERAGQRLETGMTVELEPQALDGDVIEAEIDRLRPVVDPENRSVRAVVEFENEAGWLPGTLLEAHAVVTERDEAVRVPEISVVRRPVGHVVYVVEDGEAREREVELGVRHEEWTEIRSGLEAGEVIATDGASFLSDGATVRVEEEE